MSLKCQEWLRDILKGFCKEEEEEKRTPGNICSYYNLARPMHRFHNPPDFIQSF